MKRVRIGVSVALFARGAGQAVSLGLRVFLPAGILWSVATFWWGKAAAADVLRRALAAPLVRAGGLFRLTSGGAVVRPHHVYGNGIDVAVERDIVHVRYVGGLCGEGVVRYSLRDEVRVVRLELCDERIVATGQAGGKGAARRWSGSAAWTQMQEPGARKTVIQPLTTLIQRFRFKFPRVHGRHMPSIHATHLEPRRLDPRWRLIG